MCKMKAAGTLEAWKAEADLADPDTFHMPYVGFTLALDKKGARLKIEVVSHWRYNPNLPSAVKDESVDELCVLLREPGIKELLCVDLQSKSFEAYHYYQIATAVCESTTITSLILEDPWVLCVTTGEASAFCEAIEMILDNGLLNKFRINATSSYTGYYPPEVWDALEEAIERNTSLTTVEFTLGGRRGFGSFGSQAIARIISNNASFGRLGLDGCTFARRRHITPIMQAIAEDRTLNHLSMTQLYFGRNRNVDDHRVADRFYRRLEEAVCNNATLSWVDVTPQDVYLQTARQSEIVLRRHVKENRVTRLSVFMFCLREAPEGSPFTLLRGLPFQFEEFPLVRYINEWVSRKALPPDRKRKDAPSDAEGQSAAKRAK